jgi:hypothetical protein
MPALQAYDALIPVSGLLLYIKVAKYFSNTLDESHRYPYIYNIGNERGT